MSRFRQFLISLLVALGAVSATGSESGPKLVAGSSFVLTFPEMPATYHDVVAKESAKAQMTVYLPTNYDTTKRFPLLVFLNGGDGGLGANPGVARGITEGRDFVCVSVPLFKLADAGAPEGDTIMRDPDARYMWPFFRTMLDRLEEAVPNIDAAHRILGGFSNGAHATQGLLDQSDGEIARRFSAFLFVEGGGRLGHYDFLKDKPFLMVSSQPGSRPRAEEIVAAAKAAGARTTFVFEDVGKHDFPIAAYPAVHEWLRGPALK